MPEDASKDLEECKGGDCSLGPQFDESAREPDAHKVRLTTSKYVQLLIDARETDPDCWPPGLEKAAALIERARAIEEACVDKWGEFDPEKLSRAHSREYFEIQLALDTLQDEAGDDAMNLEAALDEARQNLDENLDEHDEQPNEQPVEQTDEHDEEAPSRSSEPAPSDGFDLPSPASPPSSGFFAAPAAPTPDDDVALSLLLSEVAEPQAKMPPEVLIGANWVEVRPLPRPENYA